MTGGRDITKIELTTIGLDAAREYGVRPGSIPKSREDGERALRAWNTETPWLAPLVIAAPAEVFDFTTGYDPDRKLTRAYGIGRYFEDRVGMYETALFKGGSEPRTIHMGLDIGAVEGTPIFAPLRATVFGAEHLPSAGDYGGTVILKVDGAPSGLDLYLLLGHLSKATVARWQTGDTVSQGGLIGWLGAKEENGGWNPHLHWQLSWLEPMKIDLPGAVSGKNSLLARQIFPDPTPLLKESVAGWF